MHSKTNNAKLVYSIVEDLLNKGESLKNNITISDIKKAARIKTAGAVTSRQFEAIFNKILLKKRYFE